MKELEKEIKANTAEAPETVEFGTRETVFGDEYSEYGAQPNGDGPSSPSYFVPVRTLLRTALRPRIVGKGNKRNWAETFARLSFVYDILLSNAEISETGEFQGGEGFAAVLDPNDTFLDLVEEFYSLFPEAKDSGSEVSGDSEETPLIPNRALRPNLLLVKDTRLLNFLENLKDRFGNLVEGTRFGYDLKKELPDLFPSSEKPSRTRGRGGRPKNPNFVRLQEAISLAARSLGENLPQDKYESLLREVLEAYLNYAEKFRGLPKPEIHG